MIRWTVALLIYAGIIWLCWKVHWGLAIWAAIVIPVLLVFIGGSMLARRKDPGE